MLALPGECVSSALTLFSLLPEHLSMTFACVCVDVLPSFLSCSEQQDVATEPGSRLAMCLGDLETDENMLLKHFFASHISVGSLRGEAACIC